jgi:hypothetical protein
LRCEGSLWQQGLTGERAGKVTSLWAGRAEKQRASLSVERMEEEEAQRSISGENPQEMV